ncbi:cell wall binding repeat family protein [Bacillus clarus]|uniref:Cell wall binding repeat family protein n=1 Tax=Bacillus clarus TaxID=2338372 RepID=A0A090YSP5_9BACI|nr:hypothetical protein [Bacillus clarus]KFM95090.1 cell wall binding repeat family protein [Bacillus clarus]
MNILPQNRTFVLVFCYKYNINLLFLRRYWKQIDSVWYYFESGSKVTDWKQIDGKWYYFYPTGAMVNPGKRIIDGKTYIFDENGAMLTGWKQIASV